MGTTRVSWLQKIQDGAIFTEGFESTDFLTKQSWVTVQGSPASSIVQAKVGISSFICSGTGVTLSIIKKTIPDYSNEENVGAKPAAEVWFYDDGTTTAGTGPFFKVKTSSGFYLQVGVRNDISTTKYVYNIAATTTENNFVASGVNRAVGWHKLSIVLLLGANVQIYIDATGSNRTITPAADEKFTEVHVCSGAVGDAVGTFGYFDNVGVYLSESIYILNGSSATRSCKGWDSSGNFIFSGNLPTTGALSVVGNTYTFPYPLHFEISSATATNIEYASPYLYIYPGDVYIYQTIDFGRKVTTWNPKEEILKHQNQSTLGVTSTIFHAFKPKHLFSARGLSGIDWKRKLNNFYDDRAKGDPFSVLIDDAYCGFGVLDQDTNSATNHIHIRQNLSTDATDNFTVGRNYRIFDMGNTMRQRVTLASKDSVNSILTFNEYMTQDFREGDFISEETFYPFLEIGQNPDGLVLSKERKVVFNWEQACQEYTAT